MNTLVLRRGIYLRHMPPHNAAGGVPPSHLQDALGDHLGNCIAQAFAQWDGPPPAVHYCCSTMIDFPFSTGAINWNGLRARIAEHTPFGPHTLVNGYECASWGYCLRHGLRHHANEGPLVISIVDLNLLNLTFWQENPNWGASGFGMATLVFDPPSACAATAVQAGHARTHNMIAEFALAMRKAVAANPEVRLAKPFFPDSITQIFLRQLPHASHLPDEHPTLGHCFGADPWISIIRDAGTPPSSNNYLAASAALNGYWALACVRTVSDGQYFLGNMP